MPGSIRVSASLLRLVKKKKRSHCCIFCCADIQPPVAAPLFLQVNLGKKEYSGYIGQDGFSFPVTSLRDSMVLSLYDADKELVSKTEVKTRSIVELGSTDVVFTLDSGGEIILQLQFLLSDEDRKRIQEMRNSAMKRKQQELFGNGDELYFQESIPPKEQAEEISDIPNKEDRLTLRKSMSTDDLKRMAVFSEISIGTNTAASKKPPLQASTSEGPIDMKGLPPRSDIGSKRGQGELESRSSSAVKKMISAFESSSPQGPPLVPRIKSVGSLEGMMLASTNPSDSKRWSGRRATTIISNKKPSASRQADLLNAQESRRRSSSRRDKAAKTSMGEGAEKQNHHRRSIAPMHSGATSRIAWASHPHICITTASRQLKDLVGLEHLNSMKNAEQSAREDDTEQGTSNDDAVGSKRRRSDGFPTLNGWLINQGVRGVIVIIACGAVFLNNR
ncbi:hypothetical protein CFC21_014222 [Triticum aestivum]|uniref:Uncharacterized protein n=2 Tax=Triticum aestivum TaxID=4565 RepID=A0A3B6A2Q1_WHEAT|nr:uncharacterized protein LOC123183398 isoform X1 [Triticum aestivum]XP_044452131.1 uncharacterized protein LOC123183398 isoform X1 [Triticum aestivum]XP_044452132.1 uncharacterized protein LOC123183398 isoform X1 [Triticum aestivum]XP_044452133.1 uncharacterized protein LOC123183398 isoform X1 [Triticum aestivum]XP_044452134.1 uncharacterized protein LOC123183398 isoform X1 [Triticum aestivum]XP_044452135.1 uncharacterized protein LOC123183398 isoform X1 [Triticum aestivum]KAF6998063.1 hypo